MYELVCAYVCKRAPKCTIVSFTCFYVSFMAKGKSEGMGRENLDQATENESICMEKDVVP